MKHIIFYFLVAIESCSLVSCDNHSESVQKQITTVRAFNGKTLYDSIPLFRGMTKTYFIKNFGSPNREFDNPRSFQLLDPLPKLSNPPTKEQLDRMQIWENKFNKGEFKVTVYDSLGMTLFTNKGSDTIVFVSNFKRTFSIQF